MTQAKIVSLKEIATFTSGGTPSKKNPAFYTNGTIPWITGADINDSRSISARTNITEDAIAKSAATAMPAGTIALVTRTSVGKVGIFTQRTAFSQDITGITPGPEVDSAYLVHFLESQAHLLKRESRGATIKGVAREIVGNLPLALPSLAEQRRIAPILDEADAIRAKRRAQLAHLDELPQTLFRDAFPPGAHTARPLGELAQVNSGITKGRHTSEITRAVPYLAVANVQAGSLALENVKQIEATDREIARYSLRAGDVVLTEGGDPDKLGRGTLWRDELPTCLHQNHVFRVRFPEGGDILAQYFASLLSQREAREYFLRSAKQTSGIASINMTQLRALPVPVPDIASQEAFLERLTTIHTERDRVATALAADEELFAALQHRAFRGEL